MYNKVIHAISGYIKTKLLLPFDCLLQRNENKVIFVVRQNTYYSGNLRVVLEHLNSTYDLDLCIYKTDKCKPAIKQSLEQQGITVLDSFSLKAIYHLLTAKYFILSHSPLNAHIAKTCDKRIVINLWHGVAIKGIELLMPHLSNERKKKMKKNSEIIDYMVASSKADQDILTRSFGVSKKNIPITGLPRYDLFLPNYAFDSYLLEQQKKLHLIKSDKKIILYAPTFRDHSNSPLLQITTKEWQQIEIFIRKHNAIFAIRTHPYDKSEPAYLKNNANFVFLGNDEFTEPNLVLKIADILIVDFSSIWVDYLILNRPILGYAKDYEHYVKNERGFVYDFEKVFPGDFSASIDDLLGNLNILFSSKAFTSNHVSQKERLINYKQPSAMQNFKELVWDKLRI